MRREEVGESRVDTWIGLRGIEYEAMGVILGVSKNEERGEIRLVGGEARRVRDGGRSMGDEGGKANGEEVT